MATNRASWADALPNWVNMGSHEKVEWINVVLQSLWPHLSEACSDLVQLLVEPLLKETLRTKGLKGITLGFEQFSLGESFFAVPAKLKHTILMY